MRVELVTLLTEEIADHREHRDALDGAAADPIHSRAWWRFSAGIIPIRASMVGPPLWRRAPQVQEKFWDSRSVPMRWWVLSVFKPLCPNLNPAVVPIRTIDLRLRLQQAARGQI
jgi:hypothetical protein